MSRKLPPAIGPTAAQHFGSVAHLRAFIDENELLTPAWQIQETDRWYGGSLADARRVLLDGDRVAIDESEKLLDKYELAFSEHLPGLPERTPSVWGNAPRVAAYLAGEPLSMLRTLPGDEPRPVRVWLKAGASAHISSETLRARSIAALAYMRVLSRSMPYELWIGDTSCDGESCVQVWTRASADDLSEVSAAASGLVHRRATIPLESVLYGKTYRYGSHFHPTEARPVRAEPHDIVLEHPTEDKLDWTADIETAHATAISINNA